MRTSANTARGYALLLVLMVLALLSVGLATLLAFQEGSAATTGSLVERRRVFYACDGIGRAATVLAQSYMTTSAPSTQGLIDSICSVGGGGCCATTADTSTSPTAGTCEAVPAATRTRLTEDPAGNGPSALPLITPTGFKLTSLAFASEAPACVTNNQCVSGTCEGGFCRTLAPLPNGPFEGMNARQDTISLAITAEHRETTKFRCATNQTLTLGKIAMFQFFLFSDSAYTDWHPGPIMRASGRMHANGNIGLDGNLRIARITASGNIGCIAGGAPPAVNTNCTLANAMIANIAAPTMTNDAHFTAFTRANATWQTQALALYANGNALDAAHGVPRLQLPIVGQPQVQRGFDAANNEIVNSNSAVVNGVTREFPNSRLLVDPVLASDSLEIKRQKFAHNADIRIINGAWYLKNPKDENDWPGVIIWSDHGEHVQRAVEEFRGSSTNIGQRGANGLSTPTGAPVQWLGRTPRRFSYYGVQLAGPNAGRLIRDLGTGAAATERPVGTEFMQRAVISYGALFRDATAGEHAAVWRPGVRTLVRGSAEAWCEADPGGPPIPRTHIIDALAVASGTPSAPCTTPAGGAANAPTQAAALLAATRSGFRDGFAELLACNTDDNVNGNPTTCSGNPDPKRDRRRGNILPMNFDVHAFQEALADTTPGELGSYFCPPAVETCGAFMGRPFNGIVYLAAPYPGSENGYGINGGTSPPAQLPIPGRIHDASGVVTALHGVNHADHLLDTGLAAGRSRADTNPVGADNFAAPTGIDPTLSPWVWGNAVPLMIDRGDDDDDDNNTSEINQYEELRDDEVAALPYPLCSDGGGEALTSGGYVFTRPDCNNEATFTRINGIRLINARRINSNAAPAVAPDITQQGSLPGFPGAPVLSAAAVGQLPRGLSIVSNLPVYVVGDVNITSDAYANPNGAGHHWVPFLVGGDVVHPLSNAWDDRNARWALSNGRQSIPVAGGHRLRRASVTRYYMEILSGWGMTVAAARSGGIHNFPRALEHWGSGTAADCRGTGGFDGGCPAIIHGSLVIGHNRVYTSWPFVDDDKAGGHIGRSPPRRDWGFDPHLNNLANQPPGVPLFDVAAVRQWTRR
jgi:L-ascorbate metabolism protein UlaG (beta-lactamase superfamily)